MKRDDLTLWLAIAALLLLCIPFEGSAAQHDDGLAHLRLALVHSDSKAWEPAVREATLAVAILRKSGKPQLTVALEILGIAELALGRPADAAEHFREALVACERCEERNSLRFALASAYKDLRRYGEGEAILRKLLTETEASGTIDDRIMSLKGLASIVVEQGRRVEALPFFQEVIRLEDARGKPGPDRADNLGAIGVLLTEKGEGVQALEFFRQAEALFENSGDASSVLQLHTNVAKAYIQLGRIDQAFALLEEVEAASRKTGNKSELARTLCESAEILQVRGQLAESQKRFEECLALERQNGRLGGEARALNHLGQIEQLNGHYTKALALFEEAQAASRKTPDEQSGLTSTALGASVYQELHQGGEGDSRIERVMKEAQGLSKGNQQMADLLAIMQAFQSNRPDEALRKTDQALVLVRQANARVAEMRLLELRASFLFILQRFGEALRDAESTLVLTQELGDRNKEAELYFLAGYIALRDGRLDKAQIYLEKAVQFEHSITGSGPRARTLWALGAAYEKLANFKAAIASYREAVEITESGFSEVRADDLLAGLAENALGSYGRWANLLAQQGDAAQAFAVAERARARMFLRRMGNPPPELRKAVEPALLQEEENLQKTIESLTKQLREKQRISSSAPDEKLVELARKIDRSRLDYGSLRIRIQQANPAYASLVLPSPLTVPEIQKLLGGETTLVEYLLLEDTSLAWVIEQDSVHVIRLTANGEKLADRIEELRQRIATREPISKQAFLLYLDLFGPLAPFIHHKNVIVVPHGALHALPFGALTPDVGKVWLAEKYAFSVLPSASVLPFVMAQRNSPHGKMLALGDPDGTLPAAASEARDIASLYGAKALVGSEASAAALRSSPRPIGILHLAAHAVFDPIRPLFSRIRLADGDLAAHDILGLDLRGTRLVVLSGCETAVGPSDVGELEGLSRAFLYAGASSVAATLWKVDDAASRALMLAFYRHLRAGTPTAEALRLAQVEILHGREEWRHPYYWAAFLLTGSSVL